MYLTPTPTLSPTASLVARQTSFATTTSSSASCIPITFPTAGSIVVNSTSTIQLGPTLNVQYVPACQQTGDALAELLRNNTGSLQDGNGQFYASTTPLIYVVSATTIIAWILLILLVIGPATVSPVTRQASATWSRPWNLFVAFRENALTPGPYSRPWLQRLAALLVTISMTTVTADMFKQAEMQYQNGLFDAEAMGNAVNTSEEVRVIRIISFFFLYLALVQTLIRLFPRHKEKLIIKWIGFLLILLDIIFQCLNSFDDVSSTNKPGEFQDAIPALTYLFDLSLSLLYAAWVLYYSITKRKYAFFSPKMPGISIIALLSIISILVPVVFFIVDVINISVSAWGDYFRWVGNAAASIVVWEWVDRIEALEREEKKDGILGREIYDGDEMYDDSYPNTPSSGNQTFHYNDQRAITKRRLNGLRKRVTGRKNSERLFGLPTAIIKPIHTLGRKQPGTDEEHGEKQQSDQPVPTNDTQDDPPAPVRSPVDRALAPSADSTVYAVHIHGATPDVRGRANRESANAGRESRSDSDDDEIAAKTERTGDFAEGDNANAANRFSRFTSAFTKPIIGLASSTFRASRKSPPVEIKNILPTSSNQGDEDAERGVERGLASRLRGSGHRKRSSSGSDRAISHFSEPTIIPAPPRGQTWSPDSLSNSPVAISNVITPSPGPPETATGRQARKKPRLERETIPEEEYRHSTNEMTAPTPTINPADGRNLTGQERQNEPEQDINHQVSMEGEHISADEREPSSSTRATSQAESSSRDDLATWDDTGHAEHPDTRHQS